MNNVPDWLWQGLMEDAIWTGIAFGAAWAWKHRKDMFSGLVERERQPVLLSGVAGGRGGAAATLRVVKDADLRWKVEAPTSSLARRLEELASWYLHVS